MKKVISVFLSLMLVFSLCTVAFATEDAAPAEDVVEEVVEIVDVAEAPAESEAAPEEAEAEEPAEAEEAEAEAEAEEAVAEEETEEKGLPGNIKMLIIAVILLVFGGVVLYFGNKRLKPGTGAKKG